MRTLLAVVWIGMALTCQAADKGPDAGSYTATDNTVYSFIDVAGGGGSASVLAGTDDGVALLTLPFPFTFYGRSYTLLCASSNGLLSFVTTAAACSPSVDFANTDLTATAPPGNAPGILPLWSDLTFQVAGAGAVYYTALGTAGARRFVVEWRNAYPSGSSNPMTFEAVLFEGSNQIAFQYQTVDLGAGNPATKGAQATIGIRDANGNTANRQIAWSYNAPVLSNSSAILFTPPPSGQTSVNTITSVPPGLSVTIDGTPYATPKTVTWTPGSNHSLSVTSPVTMVGTRYTLTGWSTGATTPAISVTAGATGTTYNAAFKTEYQLSTGTNPTGVGTVSGAGWYAAGSTAQVRATAPAGYSFGFFSGDAAGSTNPVTVTMSAPKMVVANFTAVASLSMAAAVTAKADGGAAGQRSWTIRLLNMGPATATGAQLTGLVVTQTAGAPCAPSPALVTTMPVALGTIASGASATASVTINFAGCADAAARFSAKISFSANSGAYTGSTTATSQTK